MKYTVAVPLSKVAANKLFADGDPDRIKETLVSVALNEPDWRWVQERCIEFANNSAEWSVRAVCATCLGHIARIHGELDLEGALRTLEALARDPRTQGYAETALDDIRMYVRRVGSGSTSE